jgi:hypothetical protein
MSNMILPLFFEMVWQRSMTVCTQEIKPHFEVDMMNMHDRIQQADGDYRTIPRNHLRCRTPHFVDSFSLQGLDTCFLLCSNIIPVLTSKITRYYDLNFEKDSQPAVREI